MPVLVIMPSLSPTMEKGNLVKWCKKVGDEIEVGDIIAEIDTDKATMEVEALHKGILSKIIVEEGTHDVRVKSPIALIKQRNDTEQDVENFEIPSIDKPTFAPKESIAISVQVVSEAIKSDVAKASPLARRVANEYGIDISSIMNGTGPGGRIVKDDVLNFKPSKNIASEETYIDKKVGLLALAIAKKMTQCKQNIPHFYLTIKADVTDMMQILQKLKESAASKQNEVKITANSFIVRAAALAMKKHPEINVSWRDEDSLRYYTDVDISIAVAVEGGIYTPVIRCSDTKSIKQIAIEAKELADKAKTGKLKPAEYTGGSVTISNLGMYDVESFYSIVNAPQGSILSVARAVQSPVVRNQGIQIGYTLSIGYAVDHRAIDGKAAGQFLTTLKKLLENPIDIMI